MYLGGPQKCSTEPRVWLMADHLGFLCSVNYQADRIYLGAGVIDHDCHEQMKGRINWLGLTDSLGHLVVPLRLVTTRIRQLQQHRSYKHLGNQGLRLVGDEALAEGSTFYLE